MDSFEDAFGWVATCITVCLYFFPIVPFISVIKGKLNYEDAPGILVSASYVNYFCWYIYGDLIFSDQVKYCNCIGAMVCFCLIFVYLAYEIRKYTLDAILNALIIVTGSYAVYRGFTIVLDDDIIVGKICNVTAAIVYLSPIQILYKVFRDKNNYILIPIYAVVISALSTGCWILYGIAITDVYIIISYSIGLTLSCLQIIIYFIYKNKNPVFRGKEVQGDTIDIENNVDSKESTTMKGDDDTQNMNKEQPVKIESKLDN